MKKYLIYLLLILSILLQGCAEGESSSSVASVNGVCIIHTDDDDNGNCDICNTCVTVIVDLYAINDLHGKFDDTDSQPGVDELTTYLKSTVSTNENSVWLSSGDMWQGSSESNMTKGALITDWMNETGFVSMTLGNHEFDWGESYIENNAELAEFPFLAINIFDKETNTRVNYVKSSVMIEKGGIQIGIIGAIGDCYSSISGEFVEDVYFKVGDELTSLVKAESEKLRAEGADYIVYSLHDGYGSSQNGITGVSDSKLSTYYDVTLSNGYVDLVFEGHTHQKYVMLDKHGVYHLQNGGENQGISHAEVKINFANGKDKMITAEFVSKTEYQNLPDDPFVDELLVKYNEEIKEAYRIVGTNPSYLSGDSLRQLVADMYYKAGTERWGEKYDIVLGGGYISVRSPYNLKAGEVTYSDLQMLLPFDNRLVLCSVQGKYLSSRFFFTSNSDYFISYGEYGNSIKNIIDSNKTYYIVTDTYCSSYAPNHLTVVEYYDANIYARDLIANYFEGK